MNYLYECIDKLARSFPYQCSDLRYINPENLIAMQFI